MRQLCTLACAAMVATAAAPAFAADASIESAKEHFRIGSDAYRRADYATAIREFEAAYQVHPSGVIRFNLAQCYERIGDIPNALRSYHDYLREMPNADDRETVQAAMANLEHRLQARGVQQIVVYTEPPAAAVSIDGLTRGATPLSVELAPGPHDVSLSLNGFAPSTRRVTLLPDKSVELDVALQKAGTPDLTHPTVGENAYAESAPAPNTTATQAAPEDHPRVYTWVAGGVAVAAVATGAFFGARASSDASRLRDPQASHVGADNQGYADSAHHEATAANILYGVGAAAGAGAVALFFIEGSF